MNDILAKEDVVQPAASEEIVYKPLTKEMELEIADQALYFFNPGNHERIIEFIGRKRIEGRAFPFSVINFIDYLEKVAIVENAKSYSFSVSDTIRKLESANILQLSGENRTTLTNYYYYFPFVSAKKKNLHGRYWLAAALGGEFIYHFFSPYIIHITGRNKDGDPRGGSGILISPNKILTCAHVLTEMKLDDTLMVFGQEVSIRRSSFHERVDIGIIEINPVEGFKEHQVVFTEPEILDTTYVMGYPPVPYTREAALTIQKGEVSNAHSTTYDGSNIFLFSAVARPGNSGGPIISQNGAVLGIVTKDLFNKAAEDEDKNNIIMPFYAGIPTSQIIGAVTELDNELSLPVESY